MEKYQTIEEKVNEIYGIFMGGLSSSRNFIKFIRIALTEQKRVRLLDEETLRSIYHYQSSKERAKNRNGKSVEEHAVPVNTIAEILCSQFEYHKKDFTKEYILAVLEKLLWITLITEEENQKLNSAGLKNHMPDGWDWTTDNPFARYDLVGIELFVQ